MDTQWNARGPRAARLAMRAMVASVLAAASAAAWAGTVYVSPVGDDANTGAVGQPKLTIQAAVNAAGSGGTVVLAQGQYKGGGDSNVDLSGIGAGGTITIRAADGAGAVVVDCQGSRFLSLGGPTLGTVQLAGLTIQNGFASPGFGGAIAVGPGNTLVATNCVFRDNHISAASPANGGGGAVGLLRATARFTGCRFVANSVEGAAGPSVVTGGAIAAVDHSSLDLSHCSFEGNRSASTGGALGLFLADPVTLADCQFTGNSAIVGGAIDSADASPSIARCLFTANQAPNGSAISSTHGAASLYDCALFGNICATGDSPSPGIVGGVILFQNGAVTLTNCTVADNGVTGGRAQSAFATGLYAAQGANGSIRNSIVRVRTGDPALDTGGTGHYGDVQYSNVQGYAGPGAGNIDANPIFMSGAAGDYRMSPSSPGIDGGSAASVASGDTDLDGRPRVFGSAPDMGAYELFVRDATDQFTMSRGAWAYDRTNGIYTQTITVTNAGTDITTPVYLVFANVTGGTLLNAPGTTQNTNPAGLRYQNLAPGGLAHGSTASFTVAMRATSGAVGYTPLVYTGSGTP